MMVFGRQDGDQLRRGRRVAREGVWEDSTRAEKRKTSMQ